MCVLSPALESCFIYMIIHDPQLIAQNHINSKTRNYKLKIDCMDATFMSEILSIFFYFYILLLFLFIVSDDLIMHCSHGPQFVSFRYVYRCSLLISSIKWQMALKKTACQLVTVLFASAFFASMFIKIYGHHTVSPLYYNRFTYQYDGKYKICWAVMKLQLFVYFKSIFLNNIF